MRKSLKIALTIASCVLLTIALTTMGVSYAVWTSADGDATVGATDTANPSVTPDLNYVWAKYFGYTVLDDADGNGANSVEITEFYSDKFDESVGINMQEVYIPAEFWVNATTKEPIYSYDEKEAQSKAKNLITYIVTSISNNLFKDTTLKELPTTIYIPYGVKRIKTGTFVGLRNLEKVVFNNNNQCYVDVYAFVNCEKLSKIVGTSVSITDGVSIVGCATNVVTSA